MNPDLPFECRGVTPAMLTRRDLLKTVSAGFGWLAFQGLAGRAAASSLVLQAAPFGARAKRVIFLCMQGGPSHMDTFDYKPRLQQDSGRAGGGKGGKNGRLVGSPLRLAQRGQTGLSISDVFQTLSH